MNLNDTETSNMPPNFFGGGGGAGGTGARYTNPYYGVPMQFLPLNVEQQLWWANHFLFRHSFYKTVLSRVANYFITSLKIECDDPEAKKRYTDIMEKMHWKEVLSLTGINLLAYGNTFASISQGFNRFLQCPACSRISNIDKVDKYDFSAEGVYTCYCSQCKKKGVHEVIDKPSKDLSRLQVIFWNPREIKIRFDRATNEAEYYWDIPKDYVSKVTFPNNKFYSKKTPKAIYDSIYNKKMLAFNDKNFIHLKVPTPAGIPSEGKAVPFCIYLFDDFFMLKVLERFNQTIMFEDIIPFRVFSMAQQGAGNQQINPIIHQSAPQWQAGIKRMIQEHRQDPGGYSMFPFQFQYEHLGGDGKQLAPTELIQNTIGNILNSLNIPQELYTMSLQVQAMSPALRLFENSWSFMIDTYNNMLEEWADIISKIQGLPKAKIKLMPVTLSDDIERKSIIGQLVSANSIARSELLGIYGFDYRDQVRKKQEEDQINKEMQEEQQLKDQVEQMAQSGASNQGGGTTPGDVLQNAQQIAQQLFPMDGAQRRTELQKIKAEDATLYAAVKDALEQLTSGAKSQGVQGAKQQAQQPGGQPNM
jgi:hypothetical protein